MAWEISDLYGIEDDLKAMGLDVWRAWLVTRPVLLANPTQTNVNLRITETDEGAYLWIPGTDVYILIFLSADDHVLLLDVVDLMRGPD